MNNSDFQKLAKARRETRKALVLVIEDDLNQQRLYTLIQDEVGMIPCIVSNCEDGLRAAEFLEFDLIILDLQMPKVTGLECAQKIQEIERKRGIRTPIIAITAHAMAGDREKCMDAGMDDYISKPFTLDQLKEKISIWAVDRSKDAT
jgi:CheY-like chemotaxis protein